MYEMIEKEAPTEVRRKRRHVEQLRSFLQSGRDSVQLNNVKAAEVRREYNGLYQASKRPEFRGLMTVRRYGADIYLIRRG